MWRFSSPMIVGIAKLANETPRPGSYRSAASTSAVEATWTRSSSGSLVYPYRAARRLASGRCSAIRSSLSCDRPLGCTWTPLPSSDDSGPPRAGARVCLGVAAGGPPAGTTTEFQASARRLAAGRGAREVGRRHVLVAVVRHAFGEALGDDLEERQLQIVALRRLLHQAGVLGRESQPERWLEAAVDHRSRLQLEVGEVERTALDGLEEPGRVHPDPLREPDRLRRGLDYRDEPGVRDELEAGARAGLAEPKGLLADRLEDGIHPLASLVGARCQHHQLAPLRGLLGPEHGRVDQDGTALLGELRAPLDSLDPDRAHLDPRDAVGCAGQRAVVAVHRVDHGLTVDEHGQDRLGLRGRLGRGRDDGRPIPGQRLGLLRRPVPGAYF